MQQIVSSFKAVFCPSLFRICIPDLFDEKEDFYPLFITRYDLLFVNSEPVVEVKRTLDETRDDDCDIKMGETKIRMKEEISSLFSR